MKNTKPSADLLAALKCEVLGESSLRTAYYLTLKAQRRRKVLAMWRLETQTKTRILEYFVANGIEVPNLVGTVIKGTVLGILFPLSPWKGILKNTIKETEYYLKLFHRLEREAPEKDRDMFKYVVAHELAIKRFAELESENGTTDSLHPINALLVS